MKTLTRGLGLLSIYLPKEDILCTDSFLILGQALGTLPKRFNLSPSLSKGFFSFKTLTTDNLNLKKIGFPPLADFVGFNDSESVLEEKRAFVFAHRHKLFDMGRELIAYITLDVRLLAVAANCYTLQLIEIQDRLYSIFTDVTVEPHSLGYFYAFSNFYTLAQVR